MILMLHHLPQVERLDLAEAAFAVSVEDLGNGEFFDLFDVVVQNARFACRASIRPMAVFPLPMYPNSTIFIGRSVLFFLFFRNLHRLPVVQGLGDQ